MVTRKAEGPSTAPTPFIVERPPPRGRAPRSRTAPAPPASPRGLRLTARGGILAIVALSFAAALLAHVTGVAGINGGVFVAVCIATALVVRPTDLLSLTVSPPLAYFVAALAAETVLTLGSPGFSRGVAIGMATRLADVAPWLFLGTALVLVIAVFRGLPGTVRDFSDEVNGRRPRVPAKSGRPAR
ncbi:DUF6542 domain-containing protein [Nocardiopsis sediminis]|uniref:DUF6542 domain-containing protein n=1 Tax=Nocardiopsis sediminis TaxID=1778267 RepID=A0ABV8FQ61_9ACTN